MASSTIAVAQTVAPPAAAVAPARGARLFFTIQVKVPGASTLTIEREVMRPLEASMRSILGIRGVRSTAQIGVLKTRLEFDASADAEKIATAVRTRLSDLKRRWPPRAAEPLVSWGRETIPLD